MSRPDHAHIPAAVMDITSAHDPVARRRRLVRRLALLASLLMLTVVAVSAYMRLSQSGLGCDGWPACYGTGSGHEPSSLMSRASPGLAWARVTHRVVASTMLLLVLCLVAMTARHRPHLRREARLALAVLLLTLWLAGLGAAMRGATSPAVVLGNLLGGLATLALCWRLVVVAGAGTAPPAPAPALRRWAWAGLLLVLLQAALGGLVDARHAATTCRYAAECADIVRGTGWDWRVLSPWASSSLEGPLAADVRGAWLHLLHRAGALLLLPVLSVVAWKALRQDFSAQAIALGLLLVLELTLGSLLAATGFPLLAVLAHNLVAALLLALLAGLA